MHGENSRPAILCFSGLDPSGGAGLQADIESIAACGGHTLPIATCLTIQNSQHTTAVDPIDALLIKQQAMCLIEDIPVAACKIGVIPDKHIAKQISHVLKQLPDIPVVYDPVIAASQGSIFSNTETINAIKAHLLPRTTILTPNTHEVNKLTDSTIDDISEAASLCSYGIHYILCTGADDSTEQVHNTLLSKQGVLKHFQYPRLPYKYHGSGCTLSSSLACFLARNNSVRQSTELAQEYTYRSLKSAQSFGQGQRFPSRMHNL